MIVTRALIWWQAELGEHHFQAAVKAMDVPSDHVDVLTKVRSTHCAGLSWGWYRAAPYTVCVLWPE